VSQAQVPQQVRDRVRAEAGDRCGYCLCPQRYVMGILEIEHIVPAGRGGSDEEDNLWLACSLCNGFKGVQTEARDPESRKVVRLFNPRRQRWSDHFAWSKDRTRIVGKTPCGRATVIALQLNNVIAVTVREAWVSVGWHPPKGTG
jgi:hypothetical protein